MTAPRPCSGRHVVRRAADDAGRGDGLPRSLDDLGEPEVHHLDEVAARAQRLEDDVLRLEVAVHDAEVVRLGQARPALGA